MNRLVWPSVWLVAIAAIAAGLSAVSGMTYWWAFVIVGLAVVINGCVATLEDDLPGGFNNPDGTRTPRYAVVTGRLVRGFGVLLALMCMAALGVFLVGNG